MTPLTGLPGSDVLAGWLDEARGGSFEALERALRVHRPYLSELARRQSAAWTRTAPARAALVRATLDRAREEFPRFIGGTSRELRAWLGRVMGEAAEALAPAFRETEPLDPISEPATGQGPALPSTETDRVRPPRIADGPLARVAEAVAALPAPDRAVILMRHRDDLSFDEIAGRLGISPWEARAVWVRAIERLAASEGARP